MGSLVLHLLSRQRYLLTSHFVGENFKSCVVCWTRDCGVGGVVLPGVETESGVFLVVARRGRSGRSANVLITQVLFFGILVLYDLFADVTFMIVLFVYVSIVDVLVAKVVVYWTLWQTSSGAWSTSSCGGFERVCFFAGVTWWRLWRAVLTGERSGGLSAAVHYRRTGTVSLAARR